MNKSKLYLIRGIPGSGKTTKAKSMSIPDHYEADMWFERNGGFNPSRLKEAHAWCQASAFNAMREGRDCVVSNTFTRRWEMQPYYDEAARLNVEVIEIICNGEWENVHGVPKDKVQAMKQRFEK